MFKTNKINFKSFGVLLFLIIILFSCASPPPPPIAPAPGFARPAWVDSVDSTFSRSRYIAAVGTGTNRELAERSAIGNLVGLFGQAVHADQSIRQIYQEAVRGGVTTHWSDDITVDTAIRTTAAMDTLVGAEVREVWHDIRSNTFFAAAVMDRERTAQIYTDLILANYEIISNLVNMTPQERNSLEGFSRFQFAAAIADINITYGQVLSVIDVAPPVELVRGDVFRLEARNITQNIPIGIRISQDRAGRLQGEFSRALSDLGFRIGGANSPYMLIIDVDLQPVNFANNPNRFARIEVDARLTYRGVTLLPYNFNLREGHQSQSEADNRAFLSAERRINEEYRNLLSEYLSQLLPSR